MPEEQSWSTWWSTWKQRLDAMPVEPSQLAAAVVAVLVLVVAGAGWLLSGRGQAAPPVEEQLPLAAAASPTTTVPPPVVVHVAGAVVRPGVYSLPPRSRVGDAITAAGGAAPGADLDRVNLAAPVSDGERVYVTRRGEAEPVVPGPAPATAAARAGPTAVPLDLNAATVDQLEDLPGVGPATARAIVDHRGRHGPFRSVEQLLEVRGIGPSKLAGLRSKVRV